MEKRINIFFKKLFYTIITALILSLLCYIFGIILIKISNLAFVLFPYNLLLLPIVGIIIVYIKNNNKKQLSNSMVQVFDATQKEKKLSFLIIPYQICMTWLSHLSGASVGREGVALQIGATTSNMISNKFNLNKEIFTTAGKAAGFSALFGTPFAACAFVFERNKRKMKNLEFILVTIIMSFSASKFTEIFGLSHYHNNINIDVTFSFSVIMKLIVIGVIYSIVGSIFVIMLKSQKQIYSRIFKNEYIKIIVLSILFIIIMYLFNGRYMSLGTNLIDLSFDTPNNIYNYDFILKMFLTTFIISIGYQGGEVTPLFSIGATLGVVLGKIFLLPINLVAAIGYSLMFANSTNSYIAGLFICIEVFGVKTLPYILIPTLIGLIIKRKYSIYPEYKCN